MIHFMLTNQCNLACENCCFSAVRNDGKNMPLEEAKEIAKQFRLLGTKAIEITGAGDFTVYRDINEFIRYIKEIGYSVGGNTNGILAKKITEWDKFDWVRLSMNTLDFYDESKYPLDYIRSFNPSPKISGCYVWNSQGEKNIKRVIDFANKEKITVRVVPNCIQSKEGIKKEMDYIIKLLDKYEDNNYVFASDHNMDLGERRNNNCYIHHIKPCVFTDGWVYSCPSSELAVENEITMKPEFKICKGTDVCEYYTKNFEVKQHNCSYCKYKSQNEFLEDLLMETEFNDFA